MALPYDLIQFQSWIFSYFNVRAFSLHMCVNICHLMIYEHIICEM